MNISEGSIGDGFNSHVYDLELDRVDQKDCWLGPEVGSTTMEGATM